MNDTHITGALARWEVIWWSRKGKRFVVKEFDTDLHGALRLYTRVLSLKAPFTTLRCCNVGFPPPVDKRPHAKRYLKKEKIRGRIKKRIVVREIVPMEELNLQGVWWCPYCREFRKFKMQDGAMYHQNGKDYFIKGEGMYCPVCQVNHGDHHVRKWNPQAQRLAFQLGKRTRRSSGNRPTRRRTRRR